MSKAVGCLTLTGMSGFHKAPLSLTRCEDWLSGCRNQQATNSVTEFARTSYGICFLGALLAFGSIPKDAAHNLVSRTNNVLVQTFAVDANELDTPTKAQVMPTLFWTVE